MRLNFAPLLAVAATVMLSSTGAAQSYVNGIDVSKWQGSINWTSVRNSGIEFAFMKATQGYTTVDPTFVTNAQNATAAGVLIGFYHYTDFSLDPTNPADPVKQANHFLDVIKPYYDAGLYLPPVADVEGFDPLSDAGLLTKSYISNWVQSFSDTINNSLGVRPIIYGSKSTLNSYYTSTIAGQHESWEAWWKTTGTANPPVPSDTPLWGAWQFWQWTDSGSVPGISANVDRDLFNGTRAQLEGLLIGNGSGQASGITKISDFNTGEGYFGNSPTYSGSNRHLDAVTADQVTSQAYEGAGSERIVIDRDSVLNENWNLRFVSGIGSPPANPATNLAIPSTGSIGFWLKTDAPGITTQIAIDDPTASSTGVIEGGVFRSVIADGQWHLYEWSFDDDSQWNSFFNGDGSITDSSVTIDSIVFNGVSDATFYLDFVAHNPEGSLMPIAGDFSGDWLVDSRDLDVWKASLGIDAAGDANNDDVTDGSDFLIWQRNLTPAAAVQAAAAVPEPGSLTLICCAAALGWRRRRRAG